MLTRILVPLEIELADQVVSLVRGLVERRHDIEVMLLAIVPEPGDESGSPSADAPASIDLEAHRRKLAASGLMVRFDSMRGDPIERILAFARTYRVSLIAMATHGRRGLERLLRGSITEEVIRRSPVPVIAATPAAIEAVLASPAPFSRILVPLDGSERAGRIMPLVAEVAALHRAEVTILHSVDRNHVHLGVPLADILLEAPEMALRTQAAPLQRAKVAYRLMTVFGEGPQQAILDVARRERIGLVALTTHGRQGLSRWIFGSVAEEVLRLCPCPLLLQRTPLADEELALELAGATASH